MAGWPVAPAQAAVRNAEDLMIVDCLLPGQIRKLGRQATYLSARRPVRTTQADCEIRGGEYVSYDRANYQTALKVWLEGAMAGSPEAQNNVGEIYAKGLGTAPDYGMAFQWFKKAAEQGYGRAMINLGFLYEQGLGVDRNQAAALNLYREASGIEDELLYASVVQLEIRAKDDAITGLQAQVAEGEAESAGLREQVRKLQQELAQRRSALQQTRQELANTQQRLADARASQDEALTRLLENQLLSQQEQINDQRTQLAALERRSGGDGAMLAGVPRLEILDPVFVATRGRNTAVYRGGPGMRKIVGRVSAPELVREITINGKPAPIGANGGFSAEVEVPQGGAQVQVAAVDTGGVRAQLDFTLLPQAGAGSAPMAVAPATAGTLPSGVKLGRFHAVVIGNNSYRDPGYAALQSAVNDANAVASMLRSRYGYQTTVVHNATRLEILSALNEMRETLKPEDNLLIYYAGHGEIDAQGQGFWVPTDGVQDQPKSWISNAVVSDILNTVAARHVLVVADSCYSGTMTRASVPTFATGAMPPDKWNAWVKAMAGGRSRTALTSGGVMPVPDTGSGKHSFFARAFLNVLQDNDRLLEGQRLFQEVATSLALGAIDAPLAQMPEYAPIRYAGHESGEFFFMPRAGGTTGATTTGP
ncbi:MAG TPA: caspase family protein [Arenimonas sp.]|nr:caspase family protein [Arenimonas sp.]